MCCAAFVLLRRHDVPLGTQIQCASYREVSHQVPMRFSVMIEPLAMRDKKGGRSTCRVDAEDETIDCK